MNKRDKQKYTTQHERFKEAALELEADESEEAFDEKLRKIANAPQQQHKDKR
jgi:hypothetical protein